MAGRVGRGALVRGLASARRDADAAVALNPHFAFVEPRADAAPRPRGVYVHVPFCRRRCTYCDFYFEIGRSTAGFVDAVARELDARSGELVWPAQTLSFGGGTPSQLGCDDLRRIVDVVRARGLDVDAEISLEVNPEDVDDALARGLRDAGFTRASVGLQSLDDGVLRWLGRAHDRVRGTSAVRALVDAGLDAGVDLIVGVPDEGATRVDDDLARVVDAGVVHVSAYVLTVEQGTPLVSLIARGRRRPVDDDAQASAYERFQERAAAHGLRQYEISSWARPGHESRHNRLYWGRGAYLGLGPGAHSFFVDDVGRAVRRHTTARLEPWQRDPIAATVDVEHLEPAHALREAVAFGLRDLLAGVDVNLLAALHRTRVPHALAETLSRACERGDVVVDGAHHRLTARGARFADGVARDVLGAIDDEALDAGG
jgi:oxygen-independent coproporphyrinogen-3 oxidase